MKTCPVCSARCFDDMEVCYGCLHTFSSKTPQAQSVTPDEALDFEPEPVSDWVLQQAIEKSLAQKIPDSEECLPVNSSTPKHDKTHKVAPCTCADDAESEFIDVHFRVPLSAIKLLQTEVHCQREGA